MARDNFIWGAPRIHGELLMLGFKVSEACPSSKLDPHEFIGDFERLAIACFDGEADKRSGPDRAKRTPNPHRAAVGIDRTAPSNRRAGAQPNSALLLPPL